MAGAYIALLGLGILLHAAQAAEFIDHTSRLVVRQSETAELTCTVEKDNENQRVTWQFVETEFILSIEDEIDLSWNERINGTPKYAIEKSGEGTRWTYTLTINRIREVDAGTYKCIIGTPGTDWNTWPSTNTSLVVEFPPRIEHYETTKGLFIDQREDGELQCSSRGEPHPNITWTRVDGGPLPDGQLQFTGNTLQIRNATFEMGGPYLCTADNGIPPPATQVSMLVVSAPPIVTSVNDSVGQAQNRRYDAAFGCVVEGYPWPTVRWERVGYGSRQPLSYDDKFRMDRFTLAGRFSKLKTRLYTLTIKNVQANDYTDYFCIASNRMGSNEAAMTLYETSEYNDATSYLVTA